MIISLSLFLTIGTFQSPRKNQNIHSTFNNFVGKFCLFEIRRKNTVQPNRPQMTILRMRIACWITRIHTHKHKHTYTHTHTHTEYIIFIALPLLIRVEQTA